jgi:light-regulated signal transduction histidine kinase (bacteriophytochrome)
MNSVFTKAEGNLKKAIDEAGAVITYDQLPGVSGDETQLLQLLQNLIGNAIKFRKKDVQPRIHLSAERKGDEWLFGVHDNGIGIEPRFYDRIFAVFQRLHTREEFAGTGIGLAICRRIVERHGGRIWVESKPGEGSTFYFTLPATA